MKIGYPCINRSIGCTANHTFRLASYSKKRLIETVSSNLSCLFQILKFNVENGIFFFRISSEIVPFASHPVCRFDWAGYFKPEFRKIGNFIKKHGIRISMHPGQYTLINSPDKRIVKRGIAELEYHNKVLDLLGIKEDAKIQIHVGGIYNDKGESIKRFISNYGLLSKGLKRRLVIENDDRLFSLKDCLAVSKKIGIPVLFDRFHHQCYNNREPVREAIIRAKKTWKKKDGPLMVDYSQQGKKRLKGAHTQFIDIGLFGKFIKETKGIDFDIMLEIKDKEKSAIKAVSYLKGKR